MGSLTALRLFNPTALGKSVMQLYNGLLIHQTSSDDGVIEVVDQGDLRSLHFGTYPRQSTMIKSQPHRLELSYTRAMMAAVLLQDKPKKALVIGLGGGSVVKFLMHHFPDCEIDVVEYREDVINVAQQFFEVPDTHPKLHIHQGDGYRYAEQLCRDSDLYYDMVIVDAYDDVGMAESVGAQAFFDACADLLNPDGVMSINLWGSERGLFHQTLERINLSFDEQSLVLPVENKGNVIVLATLKAFSQQQLKQLRDKAELMEQSMQINLPRSLQHLLKQNRSFISRLFAY
jgi:spermidine synthase